MYFEAWLHCVVTENPLHVPIVIRIFPSSTLSKKYKMALTLMSNCSLKTSSPQTNVGITVVLNMVLVGNFLKCTWVKPALPCLTSLQAEMAPETTLRTGSQKGRQSLFHASCKPLQWELLISIQNEIHLFYLCPCRSQWDLWCLQAPEEAKQGVNRCGDGFFSVQRHLWFRL